MQDQCTGWGRLPYTIYIITPDRAETGQKGCCPPWENKSKKYGGFPRRRMEMFSCADSCISSTDFLKMLKMYCEMHKNSDGYLSALLILHKKVKRN